MLKKLLKYDLKWCLKIVTIYLAISLVLAVTGKLIDLCPDSIFFKVIGGICKGASISFGVTGLVNAIIRSWVRMINNMYKDESYLTHTIPVSISKIYLSKIISTFVILIMCIITIIISLIIEYLRTHKHPVVHAFLFHRRDKRSLRHFILERGDQDAHLIAE